MKIYVAIIHESHSDDAIELFRRRNDAIQFCKDEAKSHMHRVGKQSQRYEEKEEACTGECVYFAEFYREGDSVEVREKMV